MPYSTGCDACGSDNVAVQLCGKCVNKMTEAVESGKKDKDGNYLFKPFKHINELSRGERCTCND